MPGADGGNLKVGNWKVPKELPACMQNSHLLLSSKKELEGFCDHGEDPFFLPETEGWGKQRDNRGAKLS